jgi:hypothetical protein
VGLTHRQTARSVLCEGNIQSSSRVRRREHFRSERALAGTRDLTRPGTCSTGSQLSTQNRSAKPRSGVFHNGAKPTAYAREELEGGVQGPGTKMACRTPASLAAPPPRLTASYDGGAPGARRA